MEISFTAIFVSRRQMSLLNNNIRYYIRSRMVDVQYEKSSLTNARVYHQLRRNAYCYPAA